MHFATFAMAFAMGLAAPSALAQSADASAVPAAPAAAPLPDQATAKAHLRALIVAQQAGQVPGGLLTGQFETLLRNDPDRYPKVLQSFGAPGAMRLESHEHRYYRFDVTHPVGQVRWLISYDRGSDRINNFAWELLVAPELEPQMALWHGLKYLPGHTWKTWSLGNGGRWQYTDTCWWVDVAVRMECDRSFPDGNGQVKRIAYVLREHQLYLEGIAGEPEFLVWDDQARSVVNRRLTGDQTLSFHTHYAPTLLTIDLWGFGAPMRWVSIVEPAPGHANRVYERLNAEYIAAVAEQEAALEARRAAAEEAAMQETLAQIRADVERDNAAFEAHINAVNTMPASGTGVGNVMEGFMRGFSEATQSNEAMRQSMEDARNRGLAEGALEYARRQDEIARQEAAQRQADVEHARQVREAEEAARQARLASEEAARRARRSPDPVQVPSPVSPTGRSAVCQTETRTETARSLPLPNRGDAEAHVSGQHCAVGRKVGMGPISCSEGSEAALERSANGVDVTGRRAMYTCTATFTCHVEICERAPQGGASRQ